METKTMSKVNAAQKSKVRSMAQIGMLSAIAVVLMLFEVPLPFAPAFYEIDFSEVRCWLAVLQWGRWQERQLSS